MKNINTLIKNKLFLIENFSNFLEQINNLLDSQNFASLYNFEIEIREKYKNDKDNYKFITPLIDFISFESDNELKNQINLAIYNYDFSTNLSTHLRGCLCENFDDLESFKDIVTERIYEDEFIYYNHADEYLKDYNIFQLIKEFYQEFGEVPRNQCQLATWENRNQLSNELNSFSIILETLC